MASERRRVKVSVDGGVGRWVLVPEDAEFVSDVTAAVRRKLGCGEGSGDILLDGSVLFPGEEACILRDGDFVELRLDGLEDTVKVEGAVSEAEDVAEDEKVAEEEDAERVAAIVSQNKHEHTMRETKRFYVEEVDETEEEAPGMGDGMEEEPYKDAPEQADDALVMDPPAPKSSDSSTADNTSTEAAAASQSPVRQVAQGGRKRRLSDVARQKRNQKNRMREKRRRLERAAAACSDTPECAPIDESGNGDDCYHGLSPEQALGVGAESDQESERDEQADLDAARKLAAALVDKQVHNKPYKIRNRGAFKHGTISATLAKARANGALESSKPCAKPPMSANAQSYSTRAARFANEELRNESFYVGDDVLSPSTQAGTPTCNRQSSRAPRSVSPPSDENVGKGTSLMQSIADIAASHKEPNKLGVPCLIRLIHLSDTNEPCESSWIKCVFDPVAVSNSQLRVVACTQESLAVLERTYEAFDQGWPHTPGNEGSHVEPLILDVTCAVTMYRFDDANSSDDENLLRFSSHLEVKHGASVVGHEADGEQLRPVLRQTSATKSNLEPATIEPATPEPATPEPATPEFELSRSPERLYAVDEAGYSALEGTQDPPVHCTEANRERTRSPEYQPEMPPYPESRTADSEPPLPTLAVRNSRERAFRSNEMQVASPVYGASTCGAASPFAPRVEDGRGSSAQSPYDLAERYSTACPQQTDEVQRVDATQELDITGRRDNMYECDAPVISGNGAFANETREHLAAVEEMALNASAMRRNMLGLISETANTIVDCAPRL